MGTRQTHSMEGRQSVGAAAKPWVCVVAPLPALSINAEIQPGCTSAWARRHTGWISPTAP